MGDIYDAVDPDLEMDYTTVQTYVRRLEAKGYLHSSRRGRLKIYSAAIRRSQLERETIDDFRSQFELFKTETQHPSNCSKT